MLIRMLRQRTLTNAGQDQPLDVGEVYDLPMVVAQALIATGAARRLEDETPDDSDSGTPNRTPKRTDDGGR